MGGKGVLVSGSDHMLFAWTSVREMPIEGSRKRNVISPLYPAMVPIIMVLIKLRIRMMIHDDYSNDSDHDNDDSDKKPLESQ